MNDYSEESYFIPFHSSERLHLKRFCGDKNGMVVFLLHGSIENGRIFYSRSGKGLAPFLAKNGYDVFVADLRGRGESSPRISRDSDFGLTETIREEIPAFLEEIRRLRGEVPQIWMAHSWGGVLMLCFLARNTGYENISSMVFFATKRRIVVQGWKKFWMVKVGYNLAFRLVGKLYGFVNVSWFRTGSDNETRKARQQTYEWVTKRQWTDEDGFDYAKALRSITLPPILFMAASNDEVLGHHSDVRLFMEEIQQPGAEFYLAGKSNGHLHDYDHITLLTHHDAPKDHFVYVIHWLKKQTGRILNRETTVI